MSESMADITVNDIFQELIEENTKITECLNVLIRFKTFVDLVFDKLKTRLESNVLEMFDDLHKEVEDVFRHNKKDFSVKKILNQRKTQLFELLSSKPESTLQISCHQSRDQIKVKSKGFKPRLLSKRTSVGLKTTEGEDNRRFVCSFIGCGQQLTSRKGLLSHLRLHSSNPKPYQCDFDGCQFATRSRSELKDHINAHKGIKPFSCQHCSKQFSSARYLRSHVNYRHKVSDQVLVCGLDNCFKEFRTEFSLKNHQRFHLKEKRFVCEELNCPFKTITASLLRQHRYKVHCDERPFPCQSVGCSKAFKDRSDLNKHMLCHTSEHNFKCQFEDCGKAFKSAQTLKKHSAIHSDIEYACDWPGCEYTTKIRKCLQNHRVIHSSERNYLCNWPECGKRFKTKIQLETHQRIHTSDKRYACSWPGCQYRCTDSGNLIKHRRVHIKN